MLHPLFGATVLVAALLPCPADAAPLTLEAALDRAVQRSEAARGARAGLLGASQAAQAAAQLPDPTLRIGAENVPVTGSDRFTSHDSMTMKRVGISQEWLSRDKRDARQAAADAVVSREAVQERIAAADARLQTALAYLDAFYAVQALELTTLSEHHAHEEYDAARARLASATGGSEEVLKLAAGRGLAEDESTELRQQRASAEVALARWTGPPAGDLDPVGPLRMPTENEYVSRDPMVVALQREIDVARGAAAVAASNQRPNWTWEVSYGQRTGYSEMVSIGVSIPFPVAPAARQERETASKLALADKAEADLAEATRAATADYLSLTSEVERLQERISRYQTSVLAPAQQRTASALAAYRSNQSTLTTLFEARTRRGRSATQAAGVAARAREATGPAGVSPDPDRRRTVKRAQAVGLGVLVAALTGTAFLLGRSSGHAEPAASTVAAAAAPTASAASRRILYWHDPMVPGQRFDKPGKSPFMDMELVPVYTESDGAGGVHVSPSAQQSLGIRTTTVRRAAMASSFEAVGAVQFDERRNVAVQTRVAGYVERLGVRAPMERVRKGQALATIFAPDWLGPQNELIALKRSGVSADLIVAARDRLRALSIPDELVRRSEAAGAAQARFTLTSPANGVVSELAVREGVAVAPGTTLFRIAGLETVWAVVDVPETQALRLRSGQKVKARLQADATQSFEGELKEILPEVSATTRTLRARFEVDNAAGRLTPGMLLRLSVSTPPRERTVVAAEAVIRTGKRTVVIVSDAQGRFEPRDVTLGTDFGDDIEIVSGVEAGDRVVASGQFLIDSEASLRSALGNMSAAAPAPTAPAPPAAPAALAAPAAPAAPASTLSMSGGAGK